MPSFSSIKHEFTKTFLLKSALYSLAYVFIANIITYHAIYQNILSQTYTSTTLKLVITTQMFVNTFKIYSSLQLALFFVITLLVGFNFQLVMKKLSYLKQQKNLHVTFGAGIISLATNGCAPCGFSVLSLTGLGTVFGGMQITETLVSVVILGILLATSIYNIRALAKTSCAVRKE